MPKVPQSLPASSSQNRDSSENRVFLQLCASGAVMVMMTGAGIGAATGTAVGCSLARAGAEASGLDGACWLAQRSKQRNLAWSSAPRSLHCCQVRGVASKTAAFSAVWAVVLVYKALTAIKNRVFLVRSKRCIRCISGFFNFASPLNPVPARRVSGPRPGRQHHPVLFGQIRHARP